MTRPWSLRPAEAGDAEHVAAHGAFTVADAARRPAYAAWLRSRIESGAYVGRLAVAADGRIVGGAGAVLLDWGPTRANPCGTMARIANVHVDAAWRRRGIARALLEAVLAHCEAAGIREFNLATTPEARALYASLGFEPYPAELRRRAPTA
jgi:GNAT superfamily N-acetyltransferase